MVITKTNGKKLNILIDWLLSMEEEEE